MTLPRRIFYELRRLSSPQGAFSDRAAVIHLVPANFTDAGKLLGMFPIRNAIEALVLAAPIICFCLALLSFSLTTKIIVTMVLVIPTAGFALIGVNDDCLTRFIASWWRWRRARHIIYPKDGRQLPHFERAMLIIEEHCDIQNRQVYDQDNKSWKAIPNAIKGLIVPDDDQFTLEVALLSKLDSKASCHIYVLPADDAGEYFSIRSGNFGYSL